MAESKKFLTVLKLNYYWIVAGFVLIASTVGYIVARVYLTSEIASRKKAVVAQFEEMKRIGAAAPTHPNAQSDEEMLKLTKILASDVKQAWSAQYSRQEQLFTWPEKAFPASSYKSTVAKLNRLRPFELNIEYPANESGPNALSLKDRNVYRSYIKYVFPEMAKRIGSKWTAEIPGGSDSEGASMSNFEPIVEWPTTSQQELVSSICYWDNGSESSSPSTLQVCYAQEDLWILEGILEIIEKTNQGARANFQAAIKEIEFIRFGAAAMEQAGSVTTSSGNSKFGVGVGGGGGPLGGGGAPPDMKGLGAGRGPGGMGMGGGGGMKTGDAVERDPRANRYVDDKYVPMDGARLKQVMENLTLTDAPMFLAKRVPVRLRFKSMDQNRINEFLANCGNANLVLEVRQVRLNTDAAAAPAGLPSGGGGGGAGGKMGGMGQLGGGAGVTGPPAASKLITSNDLPVEVYGIIYLYNPINEAKLAALTGEAPALPDAGVGATPNPANGVPPTPPGVPGVNAAPAGIDPTNPNAGLPNLPAPTPPPAAPAVNPPGNPPGNADGSADDR